MKEIMRTNNAVLLNFVEVLLRDAGIPAIVADGNMSVMEGSIGILPRRVLVDEGDEAQAKRILEQADLGEWIKVK